MSSFYAGEIDAGMALQSELGHDADGHVFGPPATETIDLLLDYLDAYPNRSPLHRYIIETAWQQQDLYPCKSGELIRQAIVSEALKNLLELDLCMDEVESRS